MLFVTTRATGVLYGCYNLLPPRLVALSPRGRAVSGLAAKACKICEQPPALPAFHSITMACIVVSTCSLPPVPPFGLPPYPIKTPLRKPRNAETMAGFHRCLERAGVPWRHVDFPSAGGIPAAQTERFGTATAETPAATATPAGCSERGLSRDGATDTDVSETRQRTRKGAEYSEKERHQQPPLHPGVDLWCHPGDVEMVRFCVCGGRRR